VVTKAVTNGLQAVTSGYKRLQAVTSNPFCNHFFLLFLSHVTAVTAFLNFFSREFFSITKTRNYLIKLD